MSSEVFFIDSFVVIMALQLPKVLLRIKVQFLYLHAGETFTKIGGPKAKKKKKKS